VKPRTLLSSFRYAMEGLVYGLRTHRHLRYMFLLAAAVLLASQFLGVDRAGLVAIVVSVGLLIVAELLNAAIELAVDIACSTYHPLAKASKDAAAAAVLIASTIALFICTLVFLESPVLTAFFSSKPLPEGSGPKPLHVAMVGAVLVAIFVVLGKIWGKRGKLWRGGAVSGHAAIAAYLLGALIYKSRNDLLVISMAIALAFLVGQSRLEAGFHSLQEVLIGTLVGLAACALMLNYLA
jgi:diacylglycerol kinase (ATP)